MFRDDGNMALLANWLINDLLDIHAID